MCMSKKGIFWENLQLLAVCTLHCTMYSIRMDLVWNLLYCLMVQYEEDLLYKAGTIFFCPLFFSHPSLKQAEGGMGKTEHRIIAFVFQNQNIMLQQRCIRYIMCVMTVGSHGQNGLQCLNTKQYVLSLFLYLCWSAYPPGEGQPGQDIPTAHTCCVHKHMR